MSPRKARLRRAARGAGTHWFYRAVGMPEGFAIDPLRLVSTRDVEGVLRRSTHVEVPRLIKGDLASVGYRAGDRVVTVGVWRSGAFDIRATDLWRDRVTVGISNLGDAASFWPDGGIVRVRVGSVLCQIGCFDVSSPGPATAAPEASHVVEALARRAVRSLSRRPRARPA